MARKTMKTLTLGETTYEIVDEAARGDIEILKNNSNFNVVDILPEYVETEEGFVDTSKKYVLPDGWVYEYQEKMVNMNYAKNNLYLNKKCDKDLYQYQDAIGWVALQGFSGVSNWQSPYSINIYTKEIISAQVLAFDSGRIHMKTVEANIDELNGELLQILLKEEDFSSPVAMLMINVQLSTEALSGTDNVVKELRIEIPAENQTEIRKDWFKSDLRFVPKEGLSDEAKQEIVEAVLAALPNASGVKFG